MSKKISTIFLTLFLVGILSVSCSNKDTTGVGDGNSTGSGDGNSAVDSSKGIEQFNGNSYVSAQSYTAEQLGGTGYLWISVKDGKVGISASADNANEPTYEGYFPVTGSGTDYSFSTDYYGQANGIEGTLKFSSDGSSVTIMFTANPAFPENLLNINILCNDTIGAGDTTKGIEQYNGNSYVSTSAVMQSQYLWVSIKDSKVGMNAGSDQTSEPSYQGYMNVTGYGTDYNFSSDYYGQANGVEGTLKFSDTSVTVRFTKNLGAPDEMLNTDIVCNKKQ
ncbi:hypothetical protein Q5M87_13365 [Brachyspira innocens]|uniref:hypothetical protein n=1 Tax=Brachyspira innocens TaxID=13264 RepID=UPI0026EE179B|nr:hypothetical protein [Brachyspira innocens]MDO6994997.1 hypothetical protein [Brachyspira innocens]